MTIALPAVAKRIVDALVPESGMLVWVREASGRYGLFEEVLLQIERHGGTPLVEITNPSYLERLLDSVDQRHLAAWDRQRRGWMEQADRILVLQGDAPDFGSAPAASRQSWFQSTARLGEIEEARRVPFLLAAVPTVERARRLGMTLEALEADVLAAVAVEPAALEAEIGRVLPHLEAAQRIAIGSADGSMLSLDTSGRQWHVDAGVLPLDARSQGVQPVVNLPAGSVYATAVEDSATGRLVLPRAAEARNVRLTFETGRVASIDADEGAEALEAMFDRHSGEPRRISHIGIGLNPRLRREYGWELVDEHRHGNIFIAFGENRYLGGRNASSLNVDFVLLGGTLLADEQAIVDGGSVVV